MYEIKCPDCGWFPEDQWREGEVPCDICNEHAALECPECHELFDEIYDHTTLERRGL
jgi:hypothetical protein